jgi:cell wall-associated NlpC family hydrolase
LLGVAYRWGGCSALGLDCSGLIRLTLGLEGVPLPRDAQDQAQALRRYRIDLSPAELRAGDLVYFGDAASAIDHVALAIGGSPGRILHASGRVRIASLTGEAADFEAALSERIVHVVRPPWSRVR